MRDDGAPLCALVCDDDPASRLLAGRFLTLSFPGIEVDTAALPSEALAMVKAKPYAIVISDYHFPTLKNGVDILAASARDAPDALRVLITGRPDMEVARDALNRARVHGFVVKGADAAQFRSELAALFERLVPPGAKA